MSFQLGSAVPVGWSVEKVHVLHTEVQTSTPGAIDTVVVVVVLVAIFLTLSWALFAFQRRQLVDSESTALRELGELIEASRASVAGRPALRQDFALSVNSKSKFDRFDLPNFMSGSILENELWIASEIEVRLTATKHFVAYRLDREAIEYKLLGTSSHPKLKQDRFVAIERRLFNRRKLKAPIPKPESTGPLE